MSFTTCSAFSEVFSKYSSGKEEAFLYLELSYLPAYTVIREFTAGSWDQYALRYMKVIALKIEKLGAEATDSSCPLKRM